MPNLETLAAFFVATAIFAYMPGPATLYATARTIAGGRRAGWFAALGIHLGGYVHVVAAAFGLAVLFQAVPVLYTLLKLGGALYLIWLGARMFFTRLDADTAAKRATRHSRSAFWESVTVEVLNPKTALFYLAFLPQFADPGAALPIWAQLLILGTIVNLMFSSADAICVIAADKISGLIRSSKTAGQISRKLGGAVLIALGVNLALGEKT